MGTDTPNSEVNFVELINSIKCDEYADAIENALVVKGTKGQKIGSLVPVGSWILSDSAKIQAICDWRQNAMRFFLTQFDSTYDRTYNYLKNLSIAQDNRIFFLILDQDDQFIGHIGLSDIDGTTAEFDNLMRGSSGGDRQLIYYSKDSMLKWAFKALDLEHMSLQVISYNDRAISLYSKFGFKVTNKFPLRKSVKDGFTLHEAVEPNFANVSYTNYRMEVTREEFELVS